MTISSHSPQAAATELLIRRRARRNILDYVNAIEVPGRPATDDPDTEFFQPVETTLANHHRLLLTKLDEVSNTPFGRMMVFMPPGSAKSTYASVVFPSKYLGEKGGRKLILASYGDDLARKMGRRTRSIIRQRRYKGIWGAELSKESTAANEFSLTNGSEYMSGGLLSGLTGNRADGVIIDDPVKGREQADSETIRNKTWDAYEDDLKTRLKPGGWICIIQTRWHEDDLSGRILPEDWKGESGAILCRDGNVWQVVCLQARCEVENDPLGRQIGDYLWPQWFTPRHWAQFESNARTWSALYQQVPVPGDGILFNPDKIQIVDALPAGIRMARGWDLAATDDHTNPKADFTAGALVGRDVIGRFYIADMKRFRAGPLQVQQALINTAAWDGHEVPISGPQDPGQAGKAQAFNFVQLLAGFDVEFTPETGSKVTRAAGFAAQVEAGNVYMLRADWNKALLDELRKFPLGTHDDQVDAISRAFHRLLTAKQWAF